VDAATPWSFPEAVSGPFLETKRTVDAAPMSLGWVVREADDGPCGANGTGVSQGDSVEGLVFFSRGSQLDCRTQVMKAACVGHFQFQESIGDLCCRGKGER